MTSHIKLLMMNDQTITLHSVLFIVTRLLGRSVMDDHLQEATSPIKLLNLPSQDSGLDQDTSEIRTGFHPETTQSCPGEATERSPRSADTSEVPQSMVHDRTQRQDLCPLLLKYLMMPSDSSGTSVISLVFRKI